uniref:Uncharacterized protein n=1 Tax=Grammatophora oceanica TaxID=210454 RepID=A0A7S1VLY5_9STRA|mmetsp:Transcript_50044/g.74715  ORF Transcript_50044/g.74715 Transcript_50044/m.74715 type:complete len:323 (+) Transcript_50044:1183-2151(+)
MSSSAVTATTGFLDLNNEGVRRLSDGEYEEAAKLFHKAFSLLKAATTRRNDRTTRTDTTRPAVAIDFPSVELIPAHTSAATETTTSAASANGSARRGRAAMRPKRQTTHRGGEEKDDVDEYASSSGGDSRKRQRLETVDTRESVKRQHQRKNCPGASVECEPLGRPLWLEQTQDRRRSVLFTAGSSILYNYAYTLHRMGTQHEGCPDGDASPRSSYFRRQAMSVYSKVFRLCGKRRCPVVQWLCCHNLQQLIHTEMQVTKAADAEEIVAKLSLRYQSLETRKVLILRALFSVGVRSDILYLSVLSLLGLGGNERPDSPAAAA